MAIGGQQCRPVHARGAEIHSFPRGTGVAGRRRANEQGRATSLTYNGCLLANRAPHRREREDKPYMGVTHSVADVMERRSHKGELRPYSEHLEDWGELARVDQSSFRRVWCCSEPIRRDRRDQVSTEVNPRRREEVRTHPDDGGEDRSDKRRAEAAMQHFGQPLEEALHRGAVTLHIGG